MRWTVERCLAALDGGGEPSAAERATMRSLGAAQADLGVPRPRLGDPLWAAVTDRVQLYTWQESDPRVHACVRVESAFDTGGHLTLDATGGQTFAAADDSGDFSPCDVPVVSDPGTPPYEVRISDPLAGSPAWMCVQVGGVSRRVALDTSGGQGVVTFTGDGVT